MPLERLPKLPGRRAKNPWRNAYLRSAAETRAIAREYSSWYSW